MNLETLAAGITLPALNSEPNWDSQDWKAAFADAAVLEYKLASRVEGSAEWRSGKVYFGGTAGRFWVLAELEDEDPIAGNTGDQTLFYEEGDVFEIFIRPGGQEPYFELHISPENEKLNLRWPYAGKVRNLDPAIQPPLNPYLWTLDPLTSQTRLIPGFGWQVLASLDMTLLLEVEPNSEPWLLSFGRYDYTTGFESPVLSSTTNHAVVDFHRLHEWTPVTGVEAFL